MERKEPPQDREKTDGVSASAHAIAAELIDSPGDWHLVEDGISPYQAYVLAGQIKQWLPGTVKPEVQVVKTADQTFELYFRVHILDNL